jgi:hypothetical protein
VKPFLRPTDRGKLAPVGWVSEPVGQWAGREVDVVYDPRRHDVLLVRRDPGDSARHGFRDVGYRRVAVDGANEMWVRDRLSVISTRMDSVQRSLGRDQAAEIGGRSL